MRKAGMKTPAPARAAAPPVRTSDAPAPLAQLQASLGNRAVLRLLQRKCAACEAGEPCDGAVQCHGGPPDHHEREADRVAEVVAAGGTARVYSRVDNARIQRAALAGGATASAVDAVRGGGAPLDPGTRAVMERRMGHDFGAVRVHVDGRADASARAVNALAYTVGHDIAFRAGRYDPRSAAGQRLLAHELAHVVQQGGAATLQRKPDDGEPAPTAPLAVRLARFQKLVKDAGKLRMAENAKALEQWREFLTRQLAPAQVQGQVYAEEVRKIVDDATRRGGRETAAAEQWLTTPGPVRRWVLEQQIEGRFHACTGCHAAVRATEIDRSLGETRRLRTPLELFARAELEGGPRPTFAAGEQVLGPSAGFPHVAVAQSRINAVRPYLRQLGPDGYRVLPPETLGGTASPDQLVADIDRRIRQRQADYRTFSAKIDAPDFDYLQLRPIVRDLILIADPDVRAAIEKAIKTAEAWELVESIVIGVASIGLLLLAIFPPTTVLGVSGALALGAAVSTHQVVRGYQSYEQGKLLSLARGAHDVIDPAQQDAADAMMAMGALNMAMGTLGIAASAIGAVRLIRAPRPPAGGLGAVQGVEAKAGGNVVEVRWGTRDPYIVERAPNGTIVREGPLSSFKPGAARAQAPARGPVYVDEGGPVRVIEPLPEPPVPVPAVAPRAPTVPAQPPRVAGPLAGAGVTSGAGRIAAAIGHPPPAPAMPPGLTPAQQRLWNECLKLHDIYKATQTAAAAISAQLTALLVALNAKTRTPQGLVDACILIDELLAVLKRMHRERLDYIKHGCDQFDWFNRGTTAAQRQKAHEDAAAEVDAQIRNLYETKNRLRCT